MNMTNFDIQSEVLWTKQEKVLRLHRTIESFPDEDILPNFRFKTKDQLRKLLVGFRFLSF